MQTPEELTFYEASLPMEITDPLQEADIYDLEVRDYLNQQAESEVIQPTPAQQKFESLRQQPWYVEQLKNLSFNVRSIRPDIDFKDILVDYGDFLENSNEQAIARILLRCELRHKLKQDHLFLARQAQTEYFPNRYNYQHNRYCPQEDKEYLKRDQVQPLVFEEAPAIQIFNVIAKEALFGGRIHKIEQRIASCQQEHSLNKSFGFYDFLPSVFLIGRIWAIKNLYNHWLDQPYVNLADSATLIELVNRQVYHDLHRPPLNILRQKSSYYQIYCPLRPISFDQQRLLDYNFYQSR